VESDDPVAHVAEAGYAVDAILYGLLFWPELLELHGAVFLAVNGDDEAYVSQRLATPVGDGHADWPELSWRKVVDSFNVFEIEHLFRNWRGPTDLYEDVHRELGSMLLEPWRARLASAYPGRRFTVTLLEPDDSVGWRIEVSQLSPPLDSPKRWDPRRRAVIGTAE
jgi:hypothetical protein